MHKPSLSVPVFCEVVFVRGGNIGKLEGLRYAHKAPSIHVPRHGSQGLWICCFGLMVLFAYLALRLELKAWAAEHPRHWLVRRGVVYAWLMFTFTFTGLLRPIVRGVDIFASLTPHPSIILSR